MKPGLTAVVVPILITVQVAAIGGELAGGTVLALAPEPSSKVGAVILFADAVDRTKTLLTGEGYYEAALKKVYGADNPYIKTSVLIKDLGVTSLAGGSLLPASARRISVSQLPSVLKDLLKDKPCEVSVTVQKTTTDLHAFGGKAAGPRPTRPVQDFGVGSESAAVGPESPPLPKGMSAFEDVNQAPLTGHYHTLPKGSELPPGVRVVADGPEIVPNSPHPPTHHTFYPDKTMTVKEFNELTKTLNWKYGGKK